MDAHQPAPPTTEAIAAALLRSQQRLTDAVAPLDAAGLRAQSYDDDWSIAQVLSHLGSQSEIFDGILAAALSGSPVPGNEFNAPIWDRWNAKSPDAQAADGLAATEAHLKRILGLSDDELARWEIDLFGRQRTYDEVLLMRLGEHAVHTWDVVVALDPSAQLEDDAAHLLVGWLPELVAYFGRTPEPRSVSVHTTSPPLAFVLDLGPEGGRLRAADEAGPTPDSALSLPTEAFVRLVYGRLDPDHTPALEAVGVDLDDLRRAFPGM